MTTPRGEDIPPPIPEMLAAYADGEFEGTEALARRRQALEDWLQSHPEAAADILAWRRLKQQWQTTAAEEPGEAAWDRVWSGVEQALAQPDAGRSAAGPGFGWRRGLAAAIVLLALTATAWLVARQLTTSPPAVEQNNEQTITAEHGNPHGNGPVQDLVDKSDEVEPFPVATEDEVTILHVEGADTQTLVVGQMPVTEPLQLLRSSEMKLNSVEPDLTDAMVPSFHMERHGAAMIWSRVQREMHEP